MSGGGGCSQPARFGRPDRGGLEAVSEITGLARSTIGRGQKDLDAAPLPKGRVRRKGGGRRRSVEPGRDADRGSAADRRAGDARRSHAPTAVGVEEPRQAGRRVAEGRATRSAPTACADCCRRSATAGNRTARRTRARRHPDRNAQFEHINAKVIAAQAAGQPVISVDTKKKELIGNYKNGGTDYRPQRRSAAREGARLRGQGARQGRALRRVRRGANAGWVSVGITSDTAEFAVASIRRWLEQMGRERYPTARELTIMRRWRRLEWQPRAAVEGRAAKARRRDRPRASTSITIRRERRSGTRSSTACSATSRRHGVDGRSKVGWPWSS